MTKSDQIAEIEVELLKANYKLIDGRMSQIWTFRRTASKLGIDLLESQERPIDEKAFALEEMRHKIEEKLNKLGWHLKGRGYWEKQEIKLPVAAYKLPFEQI